MIWGLILGWILSWFGFINVVQVGCHELFNITISTTTYYFIFAILGFIACLFKKKDA